MIRIHTGNGGGYGDPQLRGSDAVTDDLLNGYVTSDRAEVVYTHPDGG